MSPPRILVVDDEVDVQAVVGDVLAEDGYDVDTVGTSQDAIDAVDRCSYDAVLCDVRLPGCHGQMLAAEIVRRRPGLANRIILLTGESSDLRATLTLPVLAKPFSLDAILDAIRARLSSP
ncbi:MAG TPA: response regulator [Methylomirabilota bacterium]|nr:response regulator [Methylomirabilota bacterium]